jgi:hypothetical protein
VMVLGPTGSPWFPSERWDDGDPIIKREGIRVEATDHFWLGPAVMLDAGFDWWAECKKWRAFGRTYLIAAMRAYAASKFGAEVELPNAPPPQPPDAGPRSRRDP